MANGRDLPDWKKPFNAKVREFYFGWKTVADLGDGEFDLFFGVEIHRALEFVGVGSSHEAERFFKNLRHSNLLAEVVITRLRERKPFLICNNP